MRRPARAWYAHISVIARARPRGPIANAYLVLNLFLAGGRMVNAQSYLSKPKSYENSGTNIFIEKTKTGKRGTPGRRICQILSAL